MNRLIEKRWAWLGLVLSAVVSLVILSASPAVAQKKQLRVLSSWPLTSAAMAHTQKWIDLVNQKSGGEFNVTYIGDGDVAGYFQQADAMVNGVCDIWYGGVAPMETKMKAVTAFPLSEITPWEERSRGFADWANKTMQKTWGFHYLGRPSWGRPWYWGVTFMVKNPREDFKGHILGSEPMIEPFVRAMGAKSEQIATAEKYTAVQQGIIEGWMMALDQAVSYSYQDVTKYLINVGFFQSSNIHLMIRQDVWQNLSKKSQGVLEDATKEIERAAKEYYAKEQEKAWEAMRAKCQVINFSADDAKWFYNLGTNALWQNVKNKVSAEEYEQLRKFFIK